MDSNRSLRATETVGVVGAGVLFCTGAHVVSRMMKCEKNNGEAERA